MLRSPAKFRSAIGALLLVLPLVPVYPPRVCGGAVCAWSTSARLRGLSPRVRGHRGQRRLAPVHPRSIPACAGAPRWYFTAPSVVWVYPRVCGGTRGASCEVVPSHGLSPRVRGHLLAVCKGQADHRSISACAGAPTARSTTSARGTVYPRVCGGTAIVLRVTKTVMGLSSRVRGHRLELFDDVLVTRSIPACAGAPLTCLERSLSKRVYPRVCGGTSTSSTNDRAAAGLSPRVRGHLMDCTVRLAIQRSIPACAGAPLTTATCSTG